MEQAGEGFSEAELAAFRRTVERLRALPADDEMRRRAEQAAAIFVRDGRVRRKKAEVDGRDAADAAVVAATATGAADRRPDAALEGTGQPGEFVRPRRCYVCKRKYQQVEGFYHMLCPSCAADNLARRALRTDLRGRRVLLTGGRVKIGFRLALMMLRDGAEVLVTSRFPYDTLARFRAVAGSAEWWERLRVVGIDLRDPRQVIGLCDELRAAGRPLDVLVNNAAQTIRRPAEAYALLVAGERALAAGGGAGLPPGAERRIRAAPGFHGAALGELPAGALEAALPTDPPVSAAVPDEAGLLPDTASVNSWSARLGALDPGEVLEAQLVNALAPTLLCDRLLPLLLASPHPRRYIVNVSAVEGRFAVRNKTARHPHTNMAKAALNMLTRTAGPELAAQGVHMCAVDTGWITDENPAPVRDRIAATGFRTPLDVVDGAARVYDPIVRGEAGAPLSGVFIKDYREAAW